MDDARAFIEAFRGTPNKCDFCDREMPPDKLHPEEAGMWVCEDCLKKWGEWEQSSPSAWQANPTSGTVNNSTWRCFFVWASPIGLGA